MQINQDQRTTQYQVGNMCLISLLEQEKRAGFYLQIK